MPGRPRKRDTPMGVSRFVSPKCLLQRWLPSASNLARESQPAGARQGSAAEVPPTLNCPLKRHARAVDGDALCLFVPESLSRCSTVDYPTGRTSARKTSSFPLWSSGPPPKSTVPENSRSGRHPGAVHAYSLQRSPPRPGSVCSRVATRRVDFGKEHVIAAGTRRRPAAENSRVFPWK